MIHPRRILTIDPAGLLWGSERALLDFIGEIPGFTAGCCCPANVPLIAQLKIRDIACFPYFRSNLHQLGKLARLIALLGLLRAIHVFRPDVLHVNQAGASRIALLAARVFRIPCVVHIRLREDIEYLRRLAPGSDFLAHFIAISPAIASLVARQPALSKIPCTMLLDAYKIKNPENKKVEDRAGTVLWDFVCIGRFADSKGQEILLRAITFVHRSGPKPRLAFVGEINECGQHLQEIVRTLGLDDSVEFLGHQNDVYPILEKSRWLVCPSEYEPLGRVLFEAWDAGIPVIASSLSGGSAESINASGGGLLFDAWTPDSLAKTLVDALQTSDADARPLVNAGRRWLSQATDPTTYSKSMALILDAAVTLHRGSK